MLVRIWGGGWSVLWLLVRFNRVFFLFLCFLGCLFVFFFVWLFFFRVFGLGCCGGGLLEGLDIVEGLFMVFFVLER